MAKIDLGDAPVGTPPTPTQQAQMRDALGLPPPLSVIDATERKTLATYTADGGPHVGFTRAIQADLTGILWMLVAADVTLDASWIGLPYTVDPDGDVVVNMQLADATGIVPDANVLMQVNGRPTIGDGVTTGGLNMGLTSDLSPLTLVGDATNNVKAYTLDEWAVRGEIDALWKDVIGTTNVALQLGQGITAIGDNAFYACTAFTGNLVLPDSVTAIGDYAFYNCSGFTALSIGQGVTTIGDLAFYGCTGFTGPLIIPDSVTILEQSAFSYCAGFTGDLTLPEGLLTTEIYSLRGLAGLTGKLTIPSTITSLGTRTFRDCTGLTECDCYVTQTIVDFNGTVFMNCTFADIHVRASDVTWTAGSQLVGGITLNVIKDLPDI